MKLYNLRLETDVDINGISCTRVLCNIDCTFSKVNELCFWVDREYGWMLTDDVYDAFLVAMLYPAMYYKEDIEVDGNVSKKLYFNIVNYAMFVVRDYALLTKKDFTPVDIKVKGYSNAKKHEKLFVGTGFSGGVDSFSTLHDRFYNEEDPDYKINALFFFHVGQYGNVKNPLSWKRAYNIFTITLNYGKIINIPAIMMNTNLFDFYQPEWEYSGGVLIRCASVLNFQRALKRYYISNGITYIERTSVSLNPNPDMAEFADPIIMSLLSPEGLEIVDDGEQYLRSEKIERIIHDQHVQKLLNVCVCKDDKHIEAKNCSMCNKCLRTLFTLDTLDSLNLFSNVFDIAKWKKQSFKYKCNCIFRYKYDTFAKDNVDFARKHGKKLPSWFFAYSYIKIIGILHLFKRIINKVLKSVSLL